MKIITLKIFITIATVISLSGVMTILDQLKLPIRYDVWNMTESQSTDDFSGLADKLYGVKFQKGQNVKSVFIVPNLNNKDGSKLLGGKASKIGGAMAIVYWLVGYDDWNSRTTAHEIVHALGGWHNNDECNLMNPANMCDVINNRTKKEVYRRQFWQKNLSKRNFRKLMRNIYE